MKPKEQIEYRKLIVDTLRDCGVGRLVHLSGDLQKVDRYYCVEAEWDNIPARVGI